MTRPKYRVRIDIGGAVGYFIVGVSVVGGPDLVAPAGAVPLFSNSAADVTGVVSSGVVQRILSTDGVVDGTLDLTLVDPWPGRFNPRNSASDIYSELRPNLRCDVDVSFDGGATWETIYVGWLDEIAPKNDFGSNVTEIKFRDNSKLDLLAGDIPSTGPITVGAALELVHAAMGWKTSTDFATGQTLADFSSSGDSTTTWRQLITSIIKVDLGTYYVSRSGVATYASRYEYALRSTVATVTVTTAQSPGMARSTIVNRATATMTGSDPQVVDSPDGGFSQGLYGIIRDQNGDIESPLFASDAAARGNAWWRAFTGASPRGKTWNIQAVDDDPDTYRAMILADMLDHVEIDVPGLEPFTEKLIQVGHNFGAAAAHLLNWRMMDIPSLSPFLVGSSLVGGPDVIVG